MPNWVYSQLGVHGSPEDVAALKAQVRKHYTQTVPDYRDRDKKVTVTHTDDFSFWNIVAPPEDKLDLYHAIHDGSEDKTWGWYNWNCSNWGVKWDASDVHMTEYADDHIAYSFSTAWGTPTEAMVTLSEQYPNVTLDLEWEEEQGYGGTLRFEKGECTVLDEYDIPNSHEELVSRKGYCYCEDDEPYFSDCPGNKIPDEMYVPDNEIDIEVVS